jgi:hypothetical protein
MKLLQHPIFIYLTNLYLSNHHEDTAKLCKTTATMKTSIYKNLKQLKNNYRNFKSYYK